MKVGIQTIKGLFFVFFLGIVLFHFAGRMASAQSNGEWPCFHGAARTNKSQETGLLKKWPENGPEPLWTVSGLGKGYSSVSISGGILYTAGMIDKKTYVFAFDLNGKQVWKKSNGTSWETTMSHARSYTGSRSTPTVDDGVVYHLSDMGRLAAFDAENGNQIWFRELRRDFEADVPEYGYSESVYIEGDRLYCNPAGRKGFMICLDKKNGDLVWANTNIPGTVGFTSPVVGEWKGIRQLINLSSNCVYGVDMQTGTLLWTVDYENQRSNNCSDPIFVDGHVFVASGYGKGSLLLKLSFSEKSVFPETVWRSELMDNLHGGVILHDGFLYGSGHNRRYWTCLDFETGKEMWKERGIGAVTFADGMLYCLEERGMMKLVRAIPEKYEEVSSFQVPAGGEGMHWAHPLVCEGRLYVRHDDKLFVYDLKGSF